MFKPGFCQKKGDHERKKVAQDGLNVWSTYPLRSAERSVFGQKKGVYDLPFFAPPPPKKQGRS